MMKYPEAGKVKTRLVPPLTHSQAALLYRCFLADTFSALSTLSGIDLFAAYDPGVTEEQVRALVPERFAIFPQEGEDLGIRMRNTFNRLLPTYEKVSMVGADSPDLPVSLITESFDRLDAAQAVFGPAKDGGYYLVALNNPADALFTGIGWGASSVLADSLERARKARIFTALLDPWHDIDRPEDLELLKDNNRAPASSRFLKELCP